MNYSWNYIAQITNLYHILSLKWLQRHWLGNIHVDQCFYIYSCLRTEVVKKIKAWKCKVSPTSLNLHILQSNSVSFYCIPQWSQSYWQAPKERPSLEHAYFWYLQITEFYTHYSISCKLVSLIRMKVDLSWNPCWF